LLEISEYTGNSCHCLKSDTPGDVTRRVPVWTWPGLSVSAKDQTEVDQVDSECMGDKQWSNRVGETTHMTCSKVRKCLINTVHESTGHRSLGKIQKIRGRKAVSEHAKRYQIRKAVSEQPCSPSHPRVRVPMSPTNVVPPSDGSTDGRKSLARSPAVPSSDVLRVPRVPFLCADYLELFVLCIYIFFTFVYQLLLSNVLRYIVVSKGCYSMNLTRHSSDERFSVTRI
jgi:hypothetical protein